VTDWDGKKTAVSQDEESNSTFEQDVLSYVKRQRPQPTMFCTTTVSK